MASAEMDVEDVGILSTIFGESLPETWRDNPNFSRYLSELSSFGVDKLSKEPDRLSEERSLIQEQTQDLAFHNYKTFIQTAECSRNIFQDFQIIETHVNDVLEKLPTFSEQCTDFLKTAQDINIRRKQNSQTLTRHTQLLEILEIPQLMDTCVRNGYYDEALELAQHVKRLEKKHPAIPVIMSIVGEVRQSTQLMLTQLIQQLRANVQLPACLRIIGYLRRLDAFSEIELRIKFLQARDSWLQGLLAAIPRNDPYLHISKVIEISRVNLFDIITQYRAIFSDDDPLVAGEVDSPNPNILFHGWVIQKVTEFLRTLEHDMSSGVGARLDSIMGQCMYFGLSFSRVGADFRPLLAPIFEQAVLNNLEAGLTEANRRFEKSMQSYSPRKKLHIPSTGYSSQGALSPPTSLLEFHPLAAYCNNVLTQFNEMRLCAPLPLAGLVAARLQESLAGVAAMLMTFYRGEESVLGPDERDQFLLFCAQYANVLVPYLNKCLQTLFPPREIALALGVPVVQVLKNQTVGVVCRETLIEPMQYLLPEPEPEPEPTKTLDSPTFAVPEPTSTEPAGESDVTETQNDVVSESDVTETQNDVVSESDVTETQSDVINEPNDGDVTEGVSVEPVVEIPVEENLGGNQSEDSKLILNEELRERLAFEASEVGTSVTDVITPDTVEISALKTDNNDDVRLGSCDVIVSPDDVVDSEILREPEASLVEAGELELTEEQLAEKTENRDSPLDLDLDLEFDELKVDED